MRRTLLVTLAALAALLLTFAVSASAADPSVQLSASMSPTNGGSLAAPKNAKFKTQFTLNADPRVTVDEITYFLPQNLRLDGTGFSTCTVAQINANGVRSCAPTSQVGKGSATLLLGPLPLTRIAFKIKVFVAAANVVSLALQSDAFSLATRGIISTAGGTFGQKIVIDVPAPLQQPQTGVYSYLTAMTLEAGAANPDETAFFASLTGCPEDHLHRFGVRLGFVPNPNPPAVASADAVSSSKCS